MAADPSNAITSDTEASLESKTGKAKPSEIVSRWLRELDAADRHESTWRDRAEKIGKLYADERDRAITEEVNSGLRRFNILFANTEVTRGALYSQTPTPDIRRRFLDKDPVGRVGATILGRSISAQIAYQHDGEDFDSVLKACVFDMALPGRGVARIKYVPTINSYQNRVPVEPPTDGAVLPEDVQEDAQGMFRMEQVDDVVNECVEVDYVEWSMFRYSPAKRWKKVRWVAFGELLTRDDLIKQFGEKIGSAVNMKWMPKGIEDTEENRIFKRALVWTIWNKTQRRCIVVTDGYKDAPLKEQDDPLKLEGFFPMPPPLYDIARTDSLVPVPEYAIYQDHAMQLDAIEERIAALTDALRYRGVRDSSVEELEGLASAGDNKFVPVKDYRQFMEKGGLSQAFQVLEIADLASVILELVKQADSKKQQIYEIIGLSDIMRGATKATETLGAQELKNQWGSIRLGPRQAEVQRFARDLVRLMAEVIAEHFSPKSLAVMTGIQLFDTVAEKQQAMQMAAQPQQQPQQPQQAVEQAESKDPRFDRPTWEEVTAVLRDDKLRSFRIDIETDSTIQPNADNEQKNRVSLVTAVTSYMEKALPAVQQGILPKKFAAELLVFAVRAFKSGPQIEELLDEWSGNEMEQEKQSPELVQLQQENAQLKQLADENAVKSKELDVRMVEANAKLQEAQKPPEVQTPEDQQIAVRKENFDRWKVVIDNAAKILVAQISAKVGSPEEEQSIQMADQAFRSEVMSSIGRISEDHNNAVAGLGDALQGIGDHLQGMMEHISSPAEIIRDPQGRATHIAKAGRLFPISRSQDGKVSGVGAMQSSQNIQ